MVVFYHMIYFCAFFLHEFKIKGIALLEYFVAILVKGVTMMCLLLFTFRDFMLLWSKSISRFWFANCLLMVEKVKVAFFEIRFPFFLFHS